MTRPAFRLTLLTWLVLSLFTPACVAQPSFNTLRIEGSELFEPSALEQALSSTPDVSQIVVLLHGYDMGSEESGRKYEELARLVSQHLAPSRALVLGVQWDSGGHSLLNPLGDYFTTLQRARTVGRGPIRQLLLQIHNQHPSAPITVLSHSMGSEIALAAVAPEISYPEQAPEGETYRPELEVRLALAVLAGSDLDYDVWKQSGEAAMNWFERVGLTWITVSDPVGQVDKVLSLRTRFRGKAAGSLMPLMSQEQLDTVLPAGKLVLDDEDIPADHELDSYFHPARVERIVATLSFLTDLGTRPPELAAIAAVLQAPNELTVLRRHLGSRHAGAAFVALWRLEHLLCGDSRHLSDQTLEEAVRLLADRPKAIWPLQAHSECHTLRLGLFPTESTMRRAGAPARSRPPRYRLPGRF